MNTKDINIAKEFSDTPAGRYRRDGPYSGERFRDEILYPALQEYDRVVVNLDGALGFGSSFLEEAFGGLIRVKGMTLSNLNNKLQICSSRRLYIGRIKQYMADAEKQKRFD
jgi:hypothetical protein